MYSAEFVWPNSTDGKISRVSDEVGIRHPGREMDQDKVPAFGLTRNFSCLLRSGMHRVISTGFMDEDVAPCPPTARSQQTGEYPKNNRQTRLSRRCQL